MGDAPGSRCQRIACWESKLLEKPSALLAERVARESPWMWPGQVMHARATDAFHRLGFGPEPPPPAAGEVLLVGVKGAQGILMRTCAHDTQVEAQVAANAALLDVWKQAQYAAISSLDVFLKPPHSLPPLRVASLTPDHGASSLDGASYGLAFALSHASLALDLPLPPDIAALSCVSTSGSLTHVDGLPIKIASILSNAIHVKCLLVCNENEEEARVLVKDAMPPVEVLACATLANAISLAWPNRKEDVREKLKVSTHATDLIDELYEQALEPSDRYPSWEVVSSTLDILGDDDLDECSRLRSRFARHVAFRHEGKNDGLEALVHDADSFLSLERRPAYVLRLQASLIQTAMDCGSPCPPSLVSAAQALWERIQSQDELLRRGELKVLGAWSRVILRDGNPLMASQISEALLDNWWAYRHRNGEEASHALCTLYHCSGLLRDKSLFERATVLQEKRSDCLTERGHWIQFSRGRALVLLGHREEALQRLDEVDHCGSKPIWMRGSLVRWYRRALAETVLSTSLFDEIKDLDCSAHDARLFATLAHLDSAILRQDATAQDNALAELRDANPGLICRLETSCPPDWTPAQWIADAYPD